MMELCQFLLLILSHFLRRSWSVVVKQEKELLTVNVGDPVEMPCYQSETNYFDMFWYQKKPGEGLKLIVWSTGAKEYSMEAAYKNTWNLTRDDTHNSLLKLTSSTKEDQAVYFCAASRGAGNERLYFGQGTVLSVMETNEQQKPPQVKIFPPNKKEFKDHNLISLVCVASGFYPEHVRLNWTINGEPRNGLYQNVASKNKDGKSFSTSKRLTLTRSEYFNPDNKFRCEAGFIGNSSDAFDEVNGESDCGVSKESYAMYINQGKISYIMVLFKSGLYALIVLAIIWRRKVLSGSC